MITTKEQDVNSKKKDKKVIKCVVWDLDNTLWQGVLLEDEKEVIESDRLLEQDDIGKVDSIWKGQFVLIFECPLRILYVFD